MKRLLGIAALWCGTASADEETAPGETIIVIDRKPDRETAKDRERALGDAPFVTIVHAEDHPATASVADALGSTVGVQTRSLGGLGAYQSISVRGAAPGHTAVLVDGVPLARLASVTTDLGRYSLSAFGEVELYRGAVPLELGGAGVGGALNLVTRLGRSERGEQVHVSTGAGSFGARHLRARHGDRFGDVETATLFGYQAATGDFQFFDHRATELNTSDDGYETRTNNGFSQFDLASRAGAVDRSLVGGIRIGRKGQGLPGTPQEPSLTPSLTTLNVLADAHGDVEVGSATARQLGYVLVEHQRLRDLDNELDLGQQDRAYLTVSGGASTTWTLPIDTHRIVGGVEVRADRFRDVDRMGVVGTTRGRREAATGMLGADLLLDPTLVVTPGVRLDIVRTAPTDDMLPTRYDTVPSPRLSARLAASEDVSAKASAGWYVRLPALLEMFGNRGAILGNPALRPERGPSADFGIVWAPAAAMGAFDRILVQGGTFATRSQDTIVFVNSVGFISKALNLSDTQTFGGELVASARIARTLTLTTNYTRLVTSQITDDKNYRNKPLPRKPGHILYARADAVRRIFDRQASLYIDANWQSESFRDQAGMMRVPGRVLAGTGARVEIVGRVAVAFDIENMTNVRVAQLPLDPPPRPDFTQTPAPIADVAGFPLPGRTLYVSLDWSH